MRIPCALHDVVCNAIMSCAHKVLLSPSGRNLPPCAGSIVQDSPVSKVSTFAIGGEEDPQKVYCTPADTTSALAPLSLSLP